MMYDTIEIISRLARGMTDQAHWRTDINSLIFALPAHQAVCAVHRGAFRTLLTGTEPTPQACLAYFADFKYAFQTAATAKIARKRIPPGTNLHLTSRDIARKLVERAEIRSGDSS